MLALVKRAKSIPSGQWFTCEIACDFRTLQQRRKPKKQSARGRENESVGDVKRSSESVSNAESERGSASGAKENASARGNGSESGSGRRTRSGSENGRGRARRSARGDGPAHGVSRPGPPPGKGRPAPTRTFSRVAMPRNLRGLLVNCPCTWKNEQMSCALSSLVRTFSKYLNVVC